MEESQSRTQENGLHLDAAVTSTRLHSRTASVRIEIGATSVRGILEGRKTHPPEGIEILAAIWTDGFDGHQLSIHQLLVGVGCPLRGRESAFRFHETTTGDPVALRHTGRKLSEARIGTHCGARGHSTKS